MTITEQIVHLSAIQFWLFTLLAACVAFVSFYYAFKHLRLARLIENTPTTQIAHAQQGYVELDGTALAPPAGEVTAPLSNTPCCWFEYKVEKRGNKRWRTLEHHKSDSEFLLDDGSGRCLVDPQGADISITRPEVWHGSHRHPPANNHQKSGNWSFLTQDIGLGARYRYTESRIHKNDPLYALGDFKTHDDIDRREQRERRRRELLREWKSQPEQLNARFDSNRDGHIDLKEWEQARLAASAQSGIDQHREEAITEPHRLTRPQDSTLPYLISTLPQFDTVRRFKRRTLLLMTTFFLSGTICVWLLGARLSI